MKELLAAFTAEIFRPIVTLLVPGFWALAPWVVSIFMWHPKAWEFAQAHRDGAGLVFVAVATAIGMILEDLGAKLETWFFLYPYE